MYILYFLVKISTLTLVSPPDFTRLNENSNGEADGLLTLPCSNGPETWVRVPPYKKCFYSLHYFHSLYEHKAEGINA